MNESFSILQNHLESQDILEKRLLYSTFECPMHQKSVSHLQTDTSTTPDAVDHVEYQSLEIANGFPFKIQEEI